MDSKSHDVHVFDYSKITDNIYVGSNFCRGKDCKDHAQEFNKLGINIEINLAKEQNELPPEDVESYTWIPVEDENPPSKAQLDVATSIIDQAVKNNKRVYIHCMHGHGRSPMVVAAYLVKYLKMTADEAIGLILSKRPEVHLEESQKVAVLNYQIP